MAHDDRERGDARRQAVLRLLRDSAEPMDVAGLAERLGVHPNTVRFHLSSLESEARVVRVESVAEGRGRPRARYRSGPEPEPERAERRYDLLAGILLEGLPPDPGARARVRGSGEAWGRRHAERSAGGGTSAPDRLVAYLDEVGFAPRRTGSRMIELHNCPFREVFEERGDLVCAIHAGLMQGALAGWGNELTVAELEPFVRPGVCRARLEHTGAAA